MELRRLVEFKCGHENSLTVEGDTVAEIKKKSELYGKTYICPWCERQQAKEKAEATAKEEGWPDLQGTEKQVTWASSLRYITIKTLEHYVITIFKLEEEEAENFISFVAETYTDAPWWIDARDEEPLSLCKRLSKKYWEKQYQAELEANKTEEEKKLEAEALAEQEKFELECTAKPADVKKSGVVKIFQEEESKVTVHYAKDADLIDTVSYLDFHWADRRKEWYKYHGSYDGDICDRIAELGHVLLNKGFTVQFPSLESKSKAITASYQPEQFVWIICSCDSEYRPDSSDLKIWFGKNRHHWFKHFAEAKALKGAKYNDNERSFMIPLEYYRDVLDFANQYGYPISETAKKAIQEQIAKEQQIQVVDVPDYVRTHESPSVKTVLLDSDTVLADLTDDDD